jgi:hypothetical protein
VSVLSGFYLCTTHRGQTWFGSTSLGILVDVWHGEEEKGWSGVMRRVKRVEGCELLHYMPGELFLTLAELL